MLDQGEADRLKRLQEEGVRPLAGSWTSRRTDREPEARLWASMLRAGDPRGVRLKAASPLPIFLDEDCRVLADLPACAERGHGVNVKSCKCGGLSEVVRLAAAGRELGLGLMIGCRLASGLGVAAAAQVASRSGRGAG